MKKIKIILLLMVVPLFFIAPACEKKIEDPAACYTLAIKKEGEVLELTVPYTVDAGREIQFINCGKSDFYAFFSGTPGHIWSEFIDPANTTTTGGDTKPGGNVNYSYQNTGEYTATMVLTNRTVGDPYNSRQVTMDFIITVTEPEK